MLPLTFAGNSAGAGGCSALVKTDTFTDVDGTQIESHGTPDWALVQGAMDINSNGVCNDYATISGAYWLATFYANQYAQGTLVGMTFGGGNIGVAVRASVGNMYAVYVQWTGTPTFFKYVAGVGPTLINSGFASFAANDVVRIEAIGATINVLKNGVVVATTTDSDLTTGAPGVCGNSDVTFPRLDSWEGGNIC